jgi:hypothetical protein
LLKSGLDPIQTLIDIIEISGRKVVAVTHSDAGGVFIVEPALFVLKQRASR